MTAREVLDGIKTRLAAATPGPWFRDSAHDQDGSNFTENVTARLWDVAFCWGGDTPPGQGRKRQAAQDADFIAAAPVDVARLTRAVEGVLGLHQPITVYEYDDTNGTFTQDGEGEQIEMKTLCAACTGDSVLELIGDCEYDDTDYHDETAWPCPTVAAIENALNP